MKVFRYWKCVELGNPGSGAQFEIARGEIKSDQGWFEAIVSAVKQTDFQWEMLTQTIEESKK